uniref:Uncharacterized protein n=1 Tax=Anguilla anguilla TaxID=7936 RepID=A0A0E9XJP9_ANGAN
MGFFFFSNPRTHGKPTTAVEGTVEHMDAPSTSCLRKGDIETLRNGMLSRSSASPHVHRIGPAFNAIRQCSKASGGSCRLNLLEISLHPQTEIAEVHTNLAVASVMFQQSYIALLHFLFNRAYILGKPTTNDTDVRYEPLCHFLSV